MKKTTMNTINGQLIKKFKHELEPGYSKLKLANELLETIRPDKAMKGDIINDIRIKIVNLFSSPNNAVSINKETIKHLLKWQDNPQTEVKPISAKLKTDIDLQWKSDGHVELRCSLRNPDDISIGEVVADLLITSTTRNGHKLYAVESYTAHVDSLINPGWRQLADWLSTEGLKVTLHQQRYVAGKCRESFFKTRQIYDYKYYGLTVRMDKDKEEQREFN